ncbi:FHA domain-containing protein [Conexibacter sp. W3-3-2]|uniref:FHA domain-containing protein n=1 Tax=Paraconexibacter algicola TaxID=2133960 RepID=A0A2T4UIZ4_9ACTN|nr:MULTISPECIES: FHA domain-containing protein [Solirubrobacterales]MTD45528.1 FHA domain-containing protein [Conexibacter sp. W3-3-2]PTL59214.1 FHA domain-containing protein [Paraconexibacter algicola]
MTLEPISVALQFGFLAVLYLFILWVSRSALKDLRSAVKPQQGPQAFQPIVGAPSDATGLHSAAELPRTDLDGLDARLVVERAPGHTAGMEYEIGEGAVMGRGDQAEIRLQDPFASSRHARLVRQGGVIVLEDLGSTNGTYLNEELLGGPQPLHAGDRVRIGDSEFTYLEG